MIRDAIAKTIRREDLTQTEAEAPLRLMNDNRSVAGIYLGSLWSEQEMLMAEVEALLELHRRGAIRPLVDAVLPFAEAPAAHRRLQERRNVGKVLLAP